MIWIKLAIIWSVTWAVAWLIIIALIKTVDWIIEIRDGLKEG